MKKQLRGSFALLAATIIWGSAFVAQSVGMDKIGPFTFQAVRCFLAVIFLCLVNFLSRPKAFLSCWRSKRLWKAGTLCGTVLFVASSLQQVGLIDTDAGKAGFLTTMYIVLVPLLGLFLGRKPPKQTAFSVALAVIGLYLLSYVGASAIAPGDLLLIGCALAFTIQITLIDKFAKDLNGLQLNCVQCFVCAVLSGVMMFFVEEPNAGNILSCWLPLGYAGVLSLGVAYTLQILGQRDLDPTTATLIMSLESVFAALSGFLILRETMTYYEAAGCLLIFAAVVLSQFKLSKKVGAKPVSQR